MKSYYNIRVIIGKGKYIYCSNKMVEVKLMKMESLNPLKIYRINFKEASFVENENMIEKSRPCIVKPRIKNYKYYGKNQVMIIPITTGYDKRLSRYIVEVGELGNALSFQMIPTTAEEIKEHREEKYINANKYKEVLDNVLMFNLEGDIMLLKDFDKKPYLIEEFEKLEASNRKLEEDNEKLRQGNKKLLIKVGEIENMIAGLETLIQNSVLSK